MASNDVVERVTAAVHDYYMEHRVNPRRITVSRGVARELDAAHSARQEGFGALLQSPKLSADGYPIWIRGIPVVADMDDKHTVDVR